MARGNIPVYDEDGRVIARVKYNDKLDFWDGRNITCGSTGRHMGYTRLKSGKWVLIHGTQWQGERDYGEVISAERLIQEAARTGHLNELYANYPELMAIGLPDEEDKSPDEERGKMVHKAIVSAFGNGAHIVVPKEFVGRTVVYYVE